MVHPHILDNWFERDYNLNYVANCLVNEVPLSPVSLEIMDASKRFNIPKSSLNDLKFFNMTVVVDNKFITINVVIGVLIHNNENKQILESFTVNKYGIPNITADLTI